MATTATTPADRLPDPSRPLPGTRNASHPALAFLLRRLGAGLLALLLASVLVFGAVQVLPGDVAQVVLGRTATPERLAAVRADLRLSDPAPVRYANWLKGVATGDLGNSSAALAQGQSLPVWRAIRVPLRNSLVLAGLTLLIFVPLCLVLGT